MSTNELRLDWREGRRRRAWELQQQGWKQQGWKQQDIAAALGVTPGAVSHSQWLKRARERGVEGLRRHPAPGRQPRLTAEQLTQLPALLAPGPGGIRLPWPGLDLPAGGRGAPPHVWRRVPPRPCEALAARRPPRRPAARRTGDPARRGGHRGLAARALARAGKKAAAQGRTVVWVDQSGFSLLPLAVRTWAPCGQTPILRVPLAHDHLAAIGGTTPDGRLFRQTQDRAYRSPAVVRFLRLLLRQVRGQPLVIWDGSPIHRGQPIKDFLHRGAAKRLHLEQLSISLIRQGVTRMGKPRHHIVAGDGLDGAADRFLKRVMSAGSKAAQQRLILENACSIGVKSGEYGGRKSRSQPCDARA